MALVYASVELPLCTPEFAAWCEAYISPALIWGEFSRRWWPGPGLSHLGSQALPWPGKVRLGSLRWPVGASRWAVAHYLATGDDVEQIRRRAYAGGVYRACTLEQDDEDGGKVKTGLWLLPARPLAQLGLPEEEGYLLTLVDDRFWWWERAAVTTIEPEETTWEDLYEQIADGLEITITVDEIPSAYLFPAASLSTDYEALPLLLDAVAQSVGQRIVRDTDGTVRAMSVASARALVRLNLADTHKTKIAGGKFALEPTG